jgi:hypothetical protein
LKSLPNWGKFIAAICMVVMATLFFAAGCAARAVGHPDPIAVSTAT